MQSDAFLVYFILKSMFILLSMYTETFDEKSLEHRIFIGV